MTFAIENLRLAELVAVTEQNKPVFDDILSFLATEGYSTLHDFIDEVDGRRAEDIILRYFERSFPEGLQLFDGVARPYSPDKAKWLMLAWILRDAPEQRLRPMLGSIAGKSLNHRRAILLNRIREHVRQFLREPERWTWPTISEVILDRLEGSRRAIKGTLFEAIVRRLLIQIFERHKLSLRVGDTEVKLEGETYDVVISGPVKKILLPVKTRETMGGGHAMLFTRDIHKSVSAAKEAGMECIPVVIAESWGGNLDSLKSKYVIYIDRNPNQIKEVEPLLEKRLEDCIDIFVDLAS
ncbi:hypothetical protein [Agrobacterium tumefaciens]|uniref:hypothetical protein n=1 Tax=Agrobacterium tumefaciens TaxID=358 RepID=UPI0005502531|nr:hypothetical protein [Agrobacterium tumefaciens]